MFVHVHICLYTTNMYMLIKYVHAYQICITLQNMVAYTNW